MERYIDFYSLVTAANQNALCHVSQPPVRADIFTHQGRSQPSQQTAAVCLAQGHSVSAQTSPGIKPTACSIASSSYIYCIYIYTVYILYIYDLLHSRERIHHLRPQPSFKKGDSSQLYLDISLSHCQESQTDPQAHIKAPHPPHPWASTKRSTEKPGKSQGGWRRHEDMNHRRWGRWGALREPKDTANERRRCSNGTRMRWCGYY